jgi:Ca-activated chloride channel homolog
MRFGEVINFASPWWLLGIPALFVVSWLAGGRKTAPAIRFSSLWAVRAVGRATSAGRGSFGLWLLLLALTFLFIALARPQLGSASETIESSGVDIVLALDVSGSMQAEDFTLGGERANRLDAVRDVTQRFIQGRPNDRIGIVAFAGRPYLVSPLTLDHAWLEKNLERLRIGLVEDGTAIGAALSSAANRLKDKPAKSKIIVLLTDGDETVKTVAPNTAAEAAKALGIKIYAIAAGTRGNAPYPVRDMFGNKAYRMMPVTVDEEALKKIAEIGGGQFFRATDSTSLNEIFSQIDRLEKTEVKLNRKVDWRDAYQAFLAAGIGLALLHLVLSHTLWRSVP